MQLPDTLEAAVLQSIEATQAALADGHNRLQLEFLLPELKPMVVAQQFLTQFPNLGNSVKVFFADAGAAALARRDWGEVPYVIRGVNELLEPIQPEDDAFVLVAPTPVEVNTIEAMCQQAGDRPFILLNPNLQDVAVVGIGYAGRQLRERFLSTLEPCYYLRPLAGGAILRAYPSPWLVWQETEVGQYDCLSEEAERPTPERLEQLFNPRTATRPQPGGWLRQMQQFLRALSQ
ncbi:DUF1995 family protein [Synechococcales cyanobacterium C]|uniref:DUF1995 family protein n=1 Tax=Petrachloros mirabilis ULC683 TaxID=2781853 RepID=A0A8K2A8J1_9CYAN|nr:DUF1995 family protein [Petrachloros mirabilis]NCJ07254.1 DUF1995 family protein [Petrachloros mirabilis ULC683]